MRQCAEQSEGRITPEGAGATCSPAALGWVSSAKQSQIWGSVRFEAGSVKLGRRGIKRFDFTLRTAAPAAQNKANLPGRRGSLFVSRR